MTQKVAGGYASGADRRIRGFLGSRSPASRERSEMASLAFFAFALFGLGLVQIVSITLWNVPLIALSTIGIIVVAVAAPVMHPGSYALIVVPLYLFRNVGYLLALAALPTVEASSFALRASLATPDAALLLMLAVHATKSAAFRPTRSMLLPALAGAFVLTLLAIEFVISDAGAAQRLAYLRSFLLPVAIFGAGRMTPARVVAQTYRFIVVGLLASAVLGALLYLFASLEGWSRLGGAYFEFKHGGVSASWGVPGIWQTTFFGYRLPRFGATLLDPIAFGYWSVAATTIAFIQRDRVAAIGFAVLAIVSLSKGAMLGVGLVAVIGLWWSSSRRADLRVLAVGAGVVGATSLIWLLDEGKGSLWVHLEGLLAGVQAAWIQPVGHGLGMGGNWAGILGTTGGLSTGAESGLGVIAYQLGLAGLLATIGFFVWQAWIRMRYEHERRLTGYSLGLLAAMAVMIAFQENALSASAAFPIWWLLGVSTPRRGRQRREA